MGYNRVAVFGGGNAGFAVAGILGLQGVDVVLCDLPRFADSIQPVAARGRIRVVGESGPWDGDAPISKVTTDLGDAINGAEALLVCAQAYAHGEVAAAVAPHLEDGQALILLPGTSLGVVEVAQRLEAEGCRADVLLGETNTLVCAARKTDKPAEVAIKHWATEVFGAGLPQSSGERVVTNLADHFPQCVEATDALETTLLNLNPYVHSAAAVLSISAVERSDADFRHYIDGITPSTARVMDSLDEERVEICQSLGYRDMSTGEIFARAGYMAQWSGNWMDDVRTSRLLREATGPFSIDYRYYTEDTGLALTSIHSIGDRLGIDMRTHEALVHLTGEMAEVDYFKTCPRTLEALGIPGNSADELRRWFE